MSAPEPLEQTLKRLREERDEADRRYNDALTALDAALLRMPALPHPPPAYDDSQITALNTSFETLAPPATGGGVKGRLAGFVWRLVAPSLQNQQRFNATLVDHLNRNVAAHRESARAMETTIALLRQQIEAFLALQARLVVYLQHVTAYVDTKDRDTAGGALVVNAALNGAVEDAAKRWESLAARDRRVDTRLSELAAAQDELRTLIGIAQQAALTMKRELGRLAAPQFQTAQSPTPQGAPQPGERMPSTAAFAPALDAYKYVGFENEFRGSQDVIRARLESYLPCFDGASDVLDVGCGRGEFLDLLAARGISGRGLDLNHEMVEVCRARGLDVAEADVVSYLEAQADGSLGGLFAAQVVEHLEPGYLLRFLELACHKLRPGAPIVLETLNPACWVAFFESFIRDITHVWPLHPETLRYLVLASGFVSATIEYRSPVPPQDRLQTIAAGDGESDLVETFNANVEKLNGRIFTYLDYAIVAKTAVAK